MPQKSKFYSSLKMLVTAPRFSFISESTLECPVSLAPLKESLIQTLQHAKLRIFTISTSKAVMEQEQRNMAALLSKFRIGFSDVIVLSDVTKKPSKDM